MYSENSLKPEKISIIAFQMIKNLNKNELLK